MVILNTIEFITIATTGNATDLVIIRGQGAFCRMEHQIVTEVSPKYE